MMNEKNILLQLIKNKLKMSKYKAEQAHIKQLLAKKTPIKVIQSVISTVNTCK